MKNIISKPTEKFPLFDRGSVQCPVERITGVWQFELPPYRHGFARSTPGHLIHLLTKGSYHLRTDGREYDVKEGDLIYYYETEEVESIGNETPVTFFSVAFQAPGFSPLPIGQRVFQASSKIKDAFLKLHQLTTQVDTPASSYSFFSALLLILQEINQLQRQNEPQVLEEANLWWQLEEQIRKRRYFRPSLDELAEWVGRSRSTVVRACREETGQSPMQRIRQLRMEEARGLLTYSSLNITQISEYFCYPRIHEFSREFSKYYGFPPSKN